MVKKKAIKIDSNNGKTHVYKPLIEKNEFLRVEGKNFLENVYEGSIKSLLLNFVKDKSLIIARACISGESSKLRHLTKVIIFKRKKLDGKYTRI